MHRLTEDDYAALYLMAHLGDALAASIKDDILGNREGAVAGFKRLHQLARQVYEEHREVFNSGHGYFPAVRVRSMVSGVWSVEDIIRRELEMTLKLPMDGISDLEITTYGQRFRARLRDFNLARDSGEDCVDGLLRDLVEGNFGWEEICAIYSAEFDAIDATGSGAGTPLPDIRRARRVR
ncbi:MAG: hypothetical protein WKF96_00775 [Solirubrobacteraceae bacterium]